MADPCRVGRLNLPRDIGSAVSDAEAARLAELATDGTILEVGSWFGFSAVVMARVARTVHSVDWHRGDPHAGEQDTLAEFWANLKRHGVRDKVVAHVGEVAAVLPFLAAESFDGAFIDGFHTTEAVARDIELVLPLIRTGGFLAFHDYGRFGVREAVDALDLPVELTETLAVVRLDAR